MNTEKFDSFISLFNLFCDKLSYNIKNNSVYLTEVKNIRKNLYCTDSPYPEFIDLWEFLNSSIFVSCSCIEEMKYQFKELVPNRVLSENIKALLEELESTFPI